MNKYLRIGKGIIFATLLFSLLYFFSRNKRLSKENIELVSNIKAYSEENSLLQNNNRIFKISSEQLKTSNDSILKKMNEVRKELKIKDKNLNTIQYVTSSVSKRDTIEFRDTIFKTKNLNLDTLLEDRWYNIKLLLKYPNIIIIKPEFLSEKYIVTSFKKETIKPSKKYWVQRLFQKKHKVLKVDVVERSPYDKNKKQRFVQIIE